MSRIDVMHPCYAYEWSTTWMSTTLCAVFAPGKWCPVSHVRKKQLELQITLCHTYEWVTRYKWVWPRAFATVNPNWYTLLNKIGNGLGRYLEEREDTHTNTHTLTCWRHFVRDRLILLLSLAARIDAFELGICAIRRLGSARIAVPTTLKNQTLLKTLKPKMRFCKICQLLCGPFFCGFA